MLLLLILCVDVCLNPVFSNLLNLFFLILPNMTKCFSLLIPLIFPSPVPSRECEFRESRDPASPVHFHIPSA